MYIMTHRGRKSLNGYADGLQMMAEERQQRLEDARARYTAACLAPLPELSEEAHRTKHARCNHLFRELMAI